MDILSWRWIKKFCFDEMLIGGWLAGNGFVDFAGSGVVHLAGGTCALVCKFFEKINIFSF